MKKITAFLGCVGVVCLFSGCFEDDSPSHAKADSPESSVSTATPNSSAAGNPDTGSSPSTTTSSATGNDTTVIHEKVVVPRNKDDYQDPYFSSGVFCWSKECEEKWAGISSNSNIQPTSSASIDISMSVEQPVPPTVTETQMVDMRDNQSYELIRIGNVHWMNTNLKYKPSKGVFCEHDGEDLCAKYGAFYSYGIAQAVCPAGWRLPTKEEVEAADQTQPHSWWTVGGRFKIGDSGEATEYGLEKEQGYIWIVQTGDYTSWRVKDYDGDNDHTFQSSEGSRAYNVRCVEGTAE